MEGLVVVSCAKQSHLATYKARIEWLLRGEGNELTQSQGQRGFILRFHEIYIVERAGISLASSCRLRN